MLVTIISFFVVLSILVLVHELGHFAVAKWSGVTVEEFGIGYPPRLLTIAKRGDTVYSINWIPFGGFTRMAGEDQEGAGKHDLSNQPKRTRIAIMAAGSIMNLILAVVCFSLAFGIGWASGKGVRVSDVMQDSPAQVAGLQGGDVILYADDVPVAYNEEFVEYVSPRADQEITLQVRRARETIEVPIVPIYNEEALKAQVGIYLTPQVTWGQAIKQGATQTANVVVITFSIPYLLIRGIVPLEAARPVGPIGIAQLAGGAVQQSLAMDWWFPILQLMGMLSTALAVTNLLPLPALDGGRILFILVEAIRGKRIAPEKEGTIHMIGFFLLISLLVVITYVDIVNPMPNIDWSALF
jgi:regulator of sigma E protease